MIHHYLQFFIKEDDLLLPINFHCKCQVENVMHNPIDSQVGSLLMMAALVVDFRNLNFLSSSCFIQMLMSIKLVGQQSAFNVPEGMDRCHRHSQFGTEKSQGLVKRCTLREQ